MSPIQQFVASAPSGGGGLLRRVGWPVSFAATVWGWIAAWLRPPGRRVGCLIGLIGAVIVAVIATFAGLMLREIDGSSRESSQAHVEQLVKAVSYQLSTTLFMVENALIEASSGLSAYDERGIPNQFGPHGQVAPDLLANFFFLDPKGRMLIATTNATELAGRDLSGRDFFRVHLDNVGLESRIGRPIDSRVTGIKLLPVSRAVRRLNGELVGVLVAMIDVQVLDRIWKEVGLRPDDVIELIGEDSTVWLSWPHRPTVDTGDDLSWSRRIAGWPMRAIARLGQATLDRETLAARRAIVVSAAAGALMVALFCLLLANRARQLVRERDATVREHANAERARDAAEATRAHLLATIDALPVEFMEIDRDRRLILSNRAARQSQAWISDPNGKTQRALLEESVESFRHHNPGRDWEAWVTQRLADLNKVGTFDFSREDGTYGRFFINEMPGGGRVVARVDITETKRKEEELAAEMERLNSVFQSTGAGILLLDNHARVLLANQFVLDTHRMTAAQMIGRPYFDLAPDRLDPAVIERWRSASDGQRLKPVEFERVVDADGAKSIIKVTANPIQDETGNLRYIVIIGVDDTERRLAEIRLFDSSRLANLGEMATGMAHEINQPLAIIRMAADSVIEELDMPEAAAMPAELAEFIKVKLARISSQTDRASGLVNELRTVARKPTNDSLPFDAAEAARVGGDLLHEQLKAARIEFTVDLPPAGPMALGEASRLQQVIINLALNARDALLEDTSRPSTGTLGHIALRVAASPTGGVILTIEDDGPGIPAQVLPRLFEPFFTTKPTGKGTGLGLSISYDIIKPMGGDITAENRTEGGARFIISLPAIGPVDEG